MQKENDDNLMSIFDVICLAQREAQKENIKANAIAINKQLYKSYLVTPFGVRVPMICGLKVIFTEELPEDTAFAVLHANNLPLTLQEKYDKLLCENTHLKEQVKEITSTLISLLNEVGGEYNG